MKKAFIVDFDGTITREDVGLSILKELASEGWQEIGEKWINREIGTAECGQKQWNLVKYNDEYIKKFVRKFKLTDGFKKFVDKVNENSCEILVTSDGYDIYINEILKSNGLHNLKVSCNSAVYDNGWKLNFINNDGKCRLCGNCKKEVVHDLKKQGFKIYYVGDGYSDRCACEYSDVIFAKSFLKKYCDEKNIPYHDFNDFYDILKCVQF